MSNVDINVDRRTDRRTDRRKIGRLYRTLLQAGAIKNNKKNWALFPQTGVQDNMFGSSENLDIYIRKP